MGCRGYTFALCALISVFGCDCGGKEGDEHLKSGRPHRVLPRVVAPEVLPAEVAEASLGQSMLGPILLLPPIVRGPRQTDAYIQEQAVVDVLWVIDNSGSLSNERGRLATQFNRFLSVLVSANVDFHVGVTSTDLNSPSADQGRLRGTPRWIDPQTSDPASVFARAVFFPVQVEIRLEEGLAAMAAALTPPLVNGFNAGFLRENAGLAVILVSDEDDGSVGRADQYIRFLKSLKGPGREVNVSLSAVVGDQPSGCVSPGDERIFGAAAKAGDRYIEVATETGGLIESICSANFAPFVETLANTLAGLRRFFPLSAPPNAQIIVTVDGRRIPEDAATGWTYDEARRGVVFEGSYVPEPGAEVRIEYDIQI